MPKNEPADQEPTTAELLEGAAKGAASATESSVGAAQATVETDADDDAADVPDKTDMSAVGDDGQVFGG